jgi:hypothetical protein
MSHERTECCGFGGLMLYANPEMGDVVARRRVSESDADFVAYGDPDLGQQTTLWILGLSLPGTVAALLVAIRINKPA